MKPVPVLYLTYPADLDALVREVNKFSGLVIPPFDIRDRYFTARCFEAIKARIAPPDCLALVLVGRGPEEIREFFHACSQVQKSGHKGPILFPVALGDRVLILKMLPLEPGGCYHWAGSAKELGDFVPKGEWTCEQF